MNIIYDESSRVFRLDTKNSSYIIAVVDKEGFLCHVHYGAPVSDTEMSIFTRQKEYPFIPGDYNRERAAFHDGFQFEFAGNGVGDFRESAVAVLDEDGGTAAEFFYRSHRIFRGKPKLPGLPASFADEQDCMTLEITTHDPVLGLDAKLLYTVFEDSDVITRSVVVENNSTRPIRLTKIMSMCMDMDDAGYDLLTLHGSWGRERHIERQKLRHGKQSVGSTRGRSSHQEHPFIALLSPNASQTTGEVYAFNFVYSGCFLAQVEKDQFDFLRVLMGINPQDFAWLLQPGESFTAPEAVMVYSAEGLDKMTHTFHDFYRNHLIRSPYRDKKRPILINNWEATYFDFDDDKLVDIARTAKQAGIEMLVMDDGWFGCRNDDNSSLGDWWVNENKLKGGIGSLVRRVNELGMKFGIWFEPEMVSMDSELCRAHPDWVIRLPGREPCLSRNQYVLDLSRRDVIDYVYESVAGILRSANIEYVKWDMNRHLCDLGSAFLEKERKGELLHRCVLGVYELQERLLEEFPDLLLENCSSGGGRYDPGMLYYSPQIWCSDNTEAIDRLAIQEGTALIYPLSTMGAHVSDCPNHAVGRTTPFETRGHVALAGTFGYELDITRISQEDRDMIPGQVALYHKHNDLVRSGDYYRVASYNDNRLYDFYGVVAKDRSEALFTYVQVIHRINMRSLRLRIPGLDADRKYRLEETGEVFYGNTLMNMGYPVTEISGDFRSRLLHFVAE
ncbi:MAG: alpha-galactosidase [Ruminococcaceae bacterium]|nr:alpha-galactosidase [Oscillospiraceae bacterium]